MLVVKWSNLHKVRLLCTGMLTRVFRIFTVLHPEVPPRLEVPPHPEVLLHLEVLLPDVHPSLLIAHHNVLFVRLSNLHKVRLLLTGALSRLLLRPLLLRSRRPLLRRRLRPLPPLLPHPLRFPLPGMNRSHCDQSLVDVSLVVQ